VTEDLEKVQIEYTQSVEITDFVEHTDSPKFFYKPYYSRTDENVRRESRYAQLHTALTDLGKLGRSKVASPKARKYLGRGLRRGL
jgi:non-homologous end joining protein Ku